MEGVWQETGKLAKRSMSSAWGCWESEEQMEVKKKKIEEVEE